jgi:AcrR family transcriptional regulator
MEVQPVERVDRRRRRHQETIEEVVGVAVAVMAEQGVAGLSLGEVARRMGIRPPSLYVYFATKNALYDAIFARGWRELAAAMEEAVGRLGQPDDPAAYLRGFGASFVRWTVEHPAYSQLMFWRPVPGYEPSPAAYEPAVRMFDRGHALMADLRARGLLAAGPPVEEMLRTWTVLLAGVTTQQLVNAPHEPFDGGTFTSLLPQLVDMFLMQYGHRGAAGAAKPAP